MKKIKAITLRSIMFLGIMTLALGSYNVDGQNFESQDETTIQDSEGTCGGGKRVCCVNVNLTHR